ncbi:MAG: hypothetical protein NTW87_26080, partial [Planctomycetota bacterium]|nr:hypothetical protein [Planctomycetota bacterium]
MTGAGLAWLRTAPPTPTGKNPTAAQVQPATAAHPQDSDPPAWTAGAVPAPPRHTVPQNDGLRAAPVFEEIADGRFQVQTERYHAMLSAADGLVYRPRPDRNVGPTGRRDTLVPPRDPAEVRVRLARVARGADAIFDRASEADAETELAVDDATGGLSFWRAPGFEERYTPRGDGVEQSFVLESRPKGNGPLTFTCELSARGLRALPPRAYRRGGLLFVDAEGRFAARYGQVVVRDSGQRGLVLEPLLAADGRSVSFAVPGPWLEAAQYPVVVDPLVGADFPVSSENTVGVAPPLVVAGNNNFLVAWNDYRAGA